MVVVPALLIALAFTLFWFYILSSWSQRRPGRAVSFQSYAACVEGGWEDLNKRLIEMEELRAGRTISEEDLDLLYEQLADQESQPELTMRLMTTVGLEDSEAAVRIFFEDLRASGTSPLVFLTADRHRD